jgi:AAA+ ATPase superfamily predicted ATPase
MFRTSTPVIDKALFDRVAELAQLEESVQSLRAGSPRWLALLGQRKVGKTSLFLELMHRAHGDDVLFVVIDSFEDRPLSLLETLSEGEKGLRLLLQKLVACSIP